MSSLGSSLAPRSTVPFDNSGKRSRTSQPGNTHMAPLAQPQASNALQSVQARYAFVLVSPAAALDFV